MGKVSDYVKQVIIGQVMENGLVILFDPERHYSEIVTSLNTPEVNVICYNGSFFELRRKASGLMQAEGQPHLLIYVPMDERGSQNALSGFTSVGAILRPGQTPRQRNTRLSVIAKQFFKGKKTEAEIQEISNKIDNQIYSITDLNDIAERGEGTKHEILMLIFDKQTPKEIALAFLSDDRYDQDIIKKRSLGEIKELVGMEYGAILAGETPDICRGELRRYVLVSDLLASLNGQIPISLESVPHAANKVKKNACQDLAEEWRLNRNLQESYIAACEKVESTLGLSTINFTIEEIYSAYTFKIFDQKLQEIVGEMILQENFDKLDNILENRRKSFWSAYDPQLGAIWDFISTIHSFNIKARQIDKELKVQVKSPTEILKLYVGSSKWFELDTLHRQIEKRFFSLDGDSFRDQPALDKLIAVVRRQYYSTGAAIAERFSTSMYDSHCSIVGFLKQSDIFSNHVSPQLGKEKIAYFLVDALRFEMAKELESLIIEEFDTIISPAVAGVPTITEVGMALLVSQGGVVPEIAISGQSKISIKLGTDTLRDRKDRINYLKKNIELDVLDLKLSDLMGSPNKKVQEKIRSADLVIVTSQEIDIYGESTEPYQARLYMDDVLGNLRRAFRVLARNGIRRMVVTSDHGFLFGEELDEGKKIPAPGGMTFDLHRRVWVGRGGLANESIIYIKPDELGMVGDFEIGVPRGFGAFRVQGGDNIFFHGGISPQELVIPILTIIPKKLPIPQEMKVRWSLPLISKIISSKAFTVRVEGIVESIDDIHPPKVRLEIRSEGKCISRPFTSLYGYEQATGDVQLKLDPNNNRKIELNTITVLIGDQFGKTASIHLLEANSGVELMRKEDIPIVLSF